MQLIYRRNRQEWTNSRNPPEIANQKQRLVNRINAFPIQKQQFLMNQSSASSPSIFQSRQKTALSNLHPSSIHIIHIILLHLFHILHILHILHISSIISQGISPIFPRFSPVFPSSPAANCALRIRASTTAVGSRTSPLSSKVLVPPERPMTSRKPWANHGKTWDENMKNRKKIWKIWWENMMIPRWVYDGIWEIWDISAKIRWYESCWSRVTHSFW